MTLNDLRHQTKIGGFSAFFAIWGCHTHFKSELRRNHWIWTKTTFQQLNVNFNSVSFDPLGSKSTPFILRMRASNVATPSKHAISAMSTSLAQERLQIDSDLLLIITSTADDLSEGTNTDYLERPWSQKIARFSDFSRFQAGTHI